MTWHRTMNKTGYFTDFALPPWFRGPETLRIALQDLWNQCYPDLYEEDCSDPRPLTEAVNRVLAIFSEGTLAHQRYVWMALTFCEAAAVTVGAYLPEDLRSTFVLGRLETWLHDPAAPARENIAAMFSPTVTAPQPLHEALNVLFQGLIALDATNAADALSEIVDDCIEGYAIIPGSDGRRDLFNWWLLEVVPACWCLRKPSIIYNMRLPWPPKAEPDQ